MGHVHWPDRRRHGSQDGMNVFLNTHCCSSVVETLSVVLQDSQKSLREQFPSWIDQERLMAVALLKVIRTVWKLLNEIWIWWINPELLWESLHRFIWSNLLSYYHIIYTQKLRSSRQPVRTEDEINWKNYDRNILLLCRSMYFLVIIVVILIKTLFFNFLFLIYCNIFFRFNSLNYIFFCVLILPVNFCFAELFIKRKTELLHFNRLM